MEFGSVEGRPVFRAFLARLDSLRKRRGFLLSFVSLCAWQGLKPVPSIGFIGTAEAVPCYKASENEFFCKL